MTRNEFKNDPLEGLTDLMIQDMLKQGKITVNDVRRHRGLPILGEEGQDQEVEPVEADPHMWPEGSRATLADLRGIPGGATTRSHIAERYSSEDATLE